MGPLPPRPGSPRRAAHGRVPGAAARAAGAPGTRADAAAGGGFYGAPEAAERDPAAADEAFAG